MVMDTDLNQKLCPNSPTHDMSHAQNKQKKLFFLKYAPKVSVSDPKNFLLEIVRNTQM